MLRKLLKIITSFLLAVMAIVLVVALSITLWVLTGPKSVSKLVPYIEASLNPIGSPITVSVKDVVIIWQSMDEPLDIRLKGLRAIMADGSGAGLAKLDEVSVGLDFRQLLQLRVVPRTIMLRSPAVRLFRDETGEYFLGIGQDESERVPLKLLAAGFGYSTGQSATPAGGDATSEQATEVAQGLRSIIIRDARFKLGQPGGEPLIDAPDTDVTLTRVNGAILAEIDFTLRDDARQANLHAEIKLANQHDMITGKIEINNLSPMMLERVMPETWKAAKLDIPLSGWMDVVVEESGSLALLDYSLNGGPGVFEYSEHFAEPLQLTHLHVQGQVRNNLRQFTLKQARLDFGGATLTLNGIVNRVQYDAPADIPEGITVSPEQMTVKKEGITADMVAVAENMPTNDLYKYWPKTAGPEPYRWVTTNIREGKVPHAEAKFKLTEADLGKPIPEHAFSATIQGEGVSVEFLPGYPKATNVKGVVGFTAKGMEIRSQQGDMLTGGKLKDAFLKIPDLAAMPAPMHIALKVEAPAKDIASFLSIPDLNYAVPLGLNPETITGMLDGSLVFDFNLPHSDVPHIGHELKMGIEANVKDGVQPGFLGTMNLSAVNGQLGITQDQVTYKGMMSMDAVPLDVALVHEFHPKGEFPTHYQAKGMVDATQLKVFGIPEVPFFSGQVGILADIQRKEGDFHRFTVISDLTPFAVNAPDYGLVKPVGTKATLKAEGDLAGGALALKGFQVEAPDLHLAGSASITDHMKTLKMLRLDRVEFNDNNFAGTVEAMDGGGYKIRAKGPALDLKAYFAADEAKKKAAAKDPALAEKLLAEKRPFRMDVHGEFDWIVIGKERELRKVNAKMVLNPDFCESALVRGVTGKENEFYAEVGELNGKRRLVFRTDNAGSFLQAMDFYDGMVGGELAIGGEFDDSKPDHPLIGKLQITENTLKKAPALAKIASLMSLTGIADSLSGNGVSVDRIETDIEMTDRYVLFRDGKAIGPALGLTVDEGRVNRITDEIWMAGTFVPSYTLNTVLDNIPVVGEILSGGKGEGMFAAKYTVNGVYPDAIDVDINALSMLAPGFLRNLVSTKEKPPADPVPAAPAPKP